MAREAVVQGKWPFLALSWTSQSRSSRIPMLCAALLTTALLPQPVPPPTARAAISAHGSDVGPAPLSRRAFAVSAAASAATLLAGAATPAFAESTMVTRQQAYTRYVPRIERGRDYWGTGLRRSIEKGDWATVLKAIDKKGSIDLIFGPMLLWSSSMSGKTISAKTYAMNAAVDELREATDMLRVAATGEEGQGGLFGLMGPKKVEPAKRATLARDG